MTTTAPHTTTRPTRTSDRHAPAVTVRPTQIADCCPGTRRNTTDRRRNARGLAAVIAVLVGLVAGTIATATASSTETAETAATAVSARSEVSHLGATGVQTPGQAHTARSELLSATEAFNATGTDNADISDYLATGDDRDAARSAVTALHDDATRDNLAAAGIGLFAAFVTYALVVITAVRRASHE